jgi:hypothetical protein
MSRRGEIFIGDVLGALAILKPGDPHTRRLIFELLGLARGPSAVEPPILTVSHPTIGSLVMAEEGVDQSSIGEPAEPTLSAPEIVPSTLDYLGKESRSYAEAGLGWLSSVDSLSAPIVFSDADEMIEPLFVPRWTRNIIAAAISTNSLTGRIDVDAVVKRLAEAKALVHLPLKPSPTMRKGVLVLLDMGEGLVPFAFDRDMLWRDIRRTAGADRSVALRFAGSPLRGTGRGAEDGWLDFSPPPPGTPVVLVTDLGLAHPPLAAHATTGEWLEFAQIINGAHCPLLAFVPYPSERIPFSLRQAMRIIFWDRSTTVATVRRCLESTPRDVE